MLVHWIWLHHRPVVSGRMKWELIQRMPDPEDIYYADSGAFDGMEGLSADAVQSLSCKDLSEASAILEQCIRKNIHILTIGDAAYPNHLKNIYEPPILLYYKGTVPDFQDQPAIGIVGTRHPSAYGVQVVRRIAQETAECGGLVVSGMAQGIDAAAMNGALLAGKNTVGILGCGVDMVYPRCNRELFADTERCGCILSEFSPGTPPLKGNFPRRNRIISGISSGVLVVEAPEKSGSLITARLAADQGRDVFVVPGNVDASGFVGSNRLLRTGAIAVSCGWDIMCEYEHLYPGKVNKAEPKKETEEKVFSNVAQHPAVPEDAPKSNKITIDNGSDAPYIDLNNILTGLTPDEQTVVTAITRKEQLVDEVIDAVDFSAGKVLAILTMLELKGKIIRHPGRRVSLAGKQ